MTVASEKTHAELIKIPLLKKICIVQVRLYELCFGLNENS
jgi:hypothetical protein